MPELPEVETTRRGIEPHLTGRRVLEVRVRQPRLRWPVPADLPEKLAGHRFRAVGRRAKYLLLCTGTGTLILHLGMTGSLRLVPSGEPAGRHDHVDFVLEGGRTLRFTDPRRFGAVLWTGKDPAQHPLLRDLGPEPLDGAFDGAHLHRQAQGRTAAVKAFLMDNRVVVGVGNIYANEALYRSGIDPRRQAGRISLERYGRLAASVKAVLTQAIEQGGTTLQEFVTGEPSPGYFAQELAVYGRGGELCRRCGSKLREVRLAGRSTVFCPRCQR